MSDDEPTPEPAPEPEAASVDGPVITDPPADPDATVVMEDAPGMATEEAIEALREIVKENERRAMALARGNPPMALDNVGLLAARFESIVNALLPPDTAARVNYETQFEEQRRAALDEAFANQRQMALQQGAPGGGLLGPSGRRI